MSNSFYDSRDELRICTYLELFFQKLYFGKNVRKNIYNNII